MKRYNNNRSTWLFDKAMNNFYKQQNETTRAIIKLAKETGQVLKKSQSQEMVGIVESGIPVPIGYHVTE